MSDMPQDKEFYELADAHIALCNTHMGKVKPAKVSASMLFAAARFNAFVIYASSENKAQFLLDFVEAENSMGFHAPQEAARVLGEASDYARQGQIAAMNWRSGTGGSASKTE